MTSVEEVVMSADPDRWRPGDSWLAGGTVLFSYGTDVTRGRPRLLLDITEAGWPDLTWHRQDGVASELEIAATCTVAAMYQLPDGADLPAPRKQLSGLDLVKPCCDSFVAGWKIWTVSTVGGNVATALRAGAMTSLLAGWDAQALLMTASTRRPHVIDVGTEEGPATVSAGRAADAAAAEEGWHDDMHGLPAWRQAMTHRLGDELLAELLPDVPTGAEGARGRHSGDLHLDRSGA